MFTKNTSKDVAVKYVPFEGADDDT